MTNIDKMNKRVIFNGESICIPNMNNKMNMLRHIKVVINTT